MRAKTEVVIGFGAAGTVFAAAMVSLLTGEAPRWSSRFEEVAFIATLPSSLASLLVRSRDQDSIAVWLISVILWSALSFLQFRVLAAVPRYFSTRTFARDVAFGVFAIIELIAVVWILSAWPTQPQEETPFFFVRAPLWLFGATTVILGLIVSSRWRHA